MKCVTPLIFTIITLASFASAAETLNCKNDFVNVGDSKASVLLKCGEPLMKDSYCVSNSDPNNTDCISVETWTYNPGSGQFLTTLKFSEGKIIEIEYGDRIP